MKPDQVIKHFGTQAAAAAAIGVGQPAVSNWVSRGNIPALSQLKFESVTNGVLKADSKILSKGKKKVSRS